MIWAFRVILAYGFMCIFFWIYPDGAAKEDLEERIDAWIVDQEDKKAARLEEEQTQNA